MAREAPEKAKAGPDLRPMIPTLADDALRNLYANAQRLETEGSTQQRAAATALLPAIQAELDSRKTVAAAQRAERAKQQLAKRKPRAKKAAAVTAEESGED
jgi:hypothetical protein